MRRYRLRQKLGVLPRRLRAWIGKIEVDSGAKSGVTTDHSQRMKEVEREVRELKRATEILKKAAAFEVPLVGISQWRSSTENRSNGGLHR